MFKMIQSIKLGIENIINYDKYIIYHEKNKRFEKETNETSKSNKYSHQF